MKPDKQTGDAGGSRKMWPVVTALVLFGLFGLALFWHSFPRRQFSEERYIYDLIWLDAWGVSFILSALLIWFARLRVRARALLLVGSFSWFGFVAIALMLAGTPYFIGGLVGDMLFRTAMVLKYKTFVWPVDFYYKGLPTFYPPVYYWLLGTAARILSVQPFHALKLGAMTLYLGGPLLLYFLWRRLVSPAQAAIVSMVSFLFVSFGHAIFFIAPHAFLGDAFFIPWWLHYVEQVKVRSADRRHYLVGGVIGGLIFMTYYVPFFLGALILGIRLFSFGRFRSFWRPSATFRWRPVLGVLGLAAAFSSPYWGPLGWSMLTIANDAAQQEWHHINSTGIALKFFEFSLEGLLYLAGVLMIFRRLRRPMNRALIILLFSVFPFLLIGSVLGALDHPINLIKSREFVVVMGGPIVGLLIALLLRLGSRRFGKRRATAAAGMIAMVLLISGFVDYGKNGAIRQARTTREPDWGFTAEQAAQFKGKVFLTGYHALYCFYPAYAFLFANQHYAHPAADYTARFHFLESLQHAPDPYAFWLGLRFNRFDAVDYYWPLPQGKDLTIPANLSNYPNGLSGRTLVYAPILTDDSALFCQIAPAGVIRVASAAEVNLSVRSCPPKLGTAAARWKPEIESYLTARGDSLLKEYLSSTGISGK